MIRLFVLLLLIIVTSGHGALAADAKVKYVLSFPAPQSHYVNVRMDISGLRGGKLKLKMPVWAPGSYLVREFSRHVENFAATDAKGGRIRFLKTSKNSWEIDAGGSSAVSISYDVYAYELTVRTSFVDEEHAYLNGTSIFMYDETFKNLPCTVKVVPFSPWKVISVALDPVVLGNPWEVVSRNYDELVDSPFEIGNHLVFSFSAAGIPHEVAMVGPGNFDVERLKKDMARIVEECTGIFGSHPCKRYLFIIHNLFSGGGGLEHLNSTTLQTGRWSYGNASTYNGFLSLVAHEYFHLWNVKRLRPEPLGPFNYDEENYTTLLWLAEGFTAYYDDLIVRRCGFTSETEYLETLAGNLSYCMNTPGSASQSLSESSYDTWIKFYRPNENSSNSSVSYYTKGAAVGALLDLVIMNATDARFSLDDVFRQMYELYYKSNDRPYREEDFIRIAEKVAGVPLGKFINGLIYGKDSLPVTEVLTKVGLRLSDRNDALSKAWAGFNTSYSNGRLTVTSVDRDSPAWMAGVNVNDEVIGMDGYRLSDDLAKFMSMKKPGEKVVFSLSRNGMLRSAELVLERSPSVSYLISKEENSSASARRCYNKWLRLP